MGRHGEWLEEEARLAKECDYQSPSEADEELRARYEHNKREVDQAEFEAYEEALGEEAGPIHIMYAGRRGSMRVRVLVRDPDLRAGSNAGCRGSLGIMGSMAEAFRAEKIAPGSHQGAEGTDVVPQQLGKRAMRSSESQNIWKSRPCDLARLTNCTRSAMLAHN